MFTLNKMKRYNKQQELLIKYASIIAEHTKLDYDSNEVQDAAMAIYTVVHGKIIRYGP